MNPDFLKKANFKGTTNLKRIENHRLEELIYQDVKIYQPTALRDIHARIGKEISKNKVRKRIYTMVESKKLSSIGIKSSTRYSF